MLSIYVELMILKCFPRSECGILTDAWRLFGREIYDGLGLIAKKYNKELG